MDSNQLNLDYYWGVEMVNLYYLPYVARHSPEKVAGRIERILDAHDRLVACRQL